MYFLASFLYNERENATTNSKHRNSQRDTWCMVTCKICKGIRHQVHDISRTSKPNDDSREQYIVCTRDGHDSQCGSINNPEGRYPKIPPLTAPRSAFADIA